jgi:hypothetical protein
LDAKKPALEAKVPALEAKVPALEAKVPALEAKDPAFEANPRDGPDEACRLLLQTPRASAENAVFEVLEARFDVHLDVFDP